MRLSHCQGINAIAQHHKALMSWYQKGYSKAGALKRQVNVGAEDINSLLATNNRDVDGSVIPELGFSIGLWNGNDQFSASFRSTCGAYNSFVNNSAVLELPHEGEPLVSHKQIRGLFIDLIAAFDPDSAVVTSDEYIDHVGGGKPWEAGGWFVYKRIFGLDGIVEHGRLGVVE